LPFRCASLAQMNSSKFKESSCRACQTAEVILYVHNAAHRAR
jgi:hypothetical protein